MKREMKSSYTLHKGVTEYYNKAKLEIRYQISYK